ncbi:MAG: glycerol-3-phosphate dehydrogenase/oxidase [Leptospirales bacterium]|nr:glycerol-3-phosphate dehydrogenase/oxidase [Leptospirales bacterium]
MKRYIEQPENKNFDVVIVGGGISGACVAYEAASRGLSVALFEKSDFGGATSAATSKLIHGGLRYLSYFELGLVRESLRERRILENIAPNFVFPLPFLIPTYKGGVSSNRWVLKLGMILYDLLSFDKGHTRDKSKKLPVHHSLSRKEIVEISPLLDKKDLSGGHVYYDCQSFSPERLTLAFIKSAVAQGARVSNYTEVTDFLRSPDGRIVGIYAKDRLTGRNSVVRGSLVINSGGPWAGTLLDKASGKKSPHSIRMSEGIHIIVPSITKEHALVLQTPARRHFFLIPWRGKSLIGTTDKDYKGNPDEYHVTRESIQEFIAEINATFGQEVIRYQDIIHAYGGLRPLTDTHTESSYSTSRRYEIFDGASEGLPGLITVEGGKYTTSRNLAASVLKVIEQNLDRTLPRSMTGKRPLFGSEMHSLDDFTEGAIRNNPDFLSQTIRYLVRAYGTEYSRILDLAREVPALAETVNPDGEILAEVLFAVREEMAVSLFDVLTHRTGLGTLGLPEAPLLGEIAGVMARELKWDQAKTAEEIESVRRRLGMPV